MDPAVYISFLLVSATVLAGAFVWIKWLGVAYLLYLGFGKLKSACSASESAEPYAVDTGRAFWRGFFVSITNPKTILFVGAGLGLAAARRQ